MFFFSASVHGFSALPWVFILPVLTQYAGRKLPFVLVCVNLLVGFIVFYCSTTAVHVLISELIQGLSFACNMTVSIIIVTEYTSPQYRGIFLTMKSATFFWGIWAANAIGTFSHWRHIGIFAFMCCTYTATSILWPESPYWLATKGRFKECTRAHHWLKGSSEEAERELENLINSQQTYLANISERKVRPLRDRLMSFIKTITTKEFYKPILLSTAMMATYHFSGKLVCSMYAVELLKRITKSDYTAYIGMLILDAVTVCGMYFGCFLSRILKRRTLLFTSSFTGILFLFLISSYLYLVELELVSENSIISITLLTSFSVTISCGPMILSSSIYGELIPLRFKSISILITALVSYSIMGIILKISPYIFKAFSLHGAFFFYGVSATIFTLILFKYLPETKDKTLQEIEEILKG